MSDPTDLADGNGLTDLAKRLTEARVEDRDRELIARVVGGLLASGEERARLLGEVDRLQAELAGANGSLAELRDRVLQLERERAELASERDAYLRAIYGLLPEPATPFTEEELRTLIHSGHSFDDILKDLESLKEA